MRSLLAQNGLTLFVVFFAAASIFTQSTDQNFPTPITTNEISGQIKARDVGDPRLTRYYYVFDGGQGDIFVNVVTKNFSGDIDVFTSETLRPMTKMVIYPDAESTSETGRLIYLRKGERLLLRVEGRSPNDDAAIFRIKFGGSFVAMAGVKADDAPAIEKTETLNESGIRVNSVGTIVQVIPKSKPAKTQVEMPPSVPVKTSPKVETKETGKTVEAAVEKTEPKKPLVIVTEAPEVATIFPAKKKPGEAIKKTDAPKSAATTARTPPVKKASQTTKAVEPAAEPKPDPLASIRLIVQLKTGEVIERSMSEVQKFSVDKGILVVIGKDGKTSRYSILDVVKVTIE